MPLLRLCYRTFIVIVRIKEQDIYTLKIICIARYIDKSQNNDKFIIYMCGNMGQMKYDSTSVSN